MEVKGCPSPCIYYEPCSAEEDALFQRVQDVPAAPPQMRPVRTGLQPVPRCRPVLRGLHSFAAVVAVCRTICS